MGHTYTEILKIRVVDRNIPYVVSQNGQNIRSFARRLFGTMVRKNDNIYARQQLLFLQCLHEKMNRSIDVRHCVFEFDTGNLIAQTCKKQLQRILWYSSARRITKLSFFHSLSLLPKLFSVRPSVAKLPRYTQNLGNPQYQQGSNIGKYDRVQRREWSTTTGGSNFCSFFV